MKKTLKFLILHFKLVLTFSETYHLFVLICTGVHTTFSIYLTAETYEDVSFQNDKAQCITLRR